jgi:hypothetical protein
MSNLISIQQDAQDLLLAIVEREPLPAMRVLASETWQYAAWRFEFAIIGESHYVRVEHEGRLVMLEILACISLKAEQCKLYQPLLEMQPFAYQETAYRVAVRFDNQLPNWSQQRHHLSYHFPITHGQIPQTRIQWQRNGGRLTWQSLHSYPEDSGLITVLTESEYHFGE